MTFIPKPQEIYRHFKGNLYQIMAVAEHTETGEQLVIYQALYGDFRIYARPLEMFVSRVDREKYPDAEQEYRFELQGGEDARRRERACSAEQPEMPAKEPERMPVPAGTSQPETVETPDMQPGLDPMLLQFLDADTYEERLNIMAGLHHRITDDMITTMAVACDVEVPDGEPEERFASLKTALLTLEKYECNRLR